MKKRIPESVCDADTKKEKISLGERLRSALDIEADTLPYGTLVEIRGRGSVTLRGCGRVIVYTDREMRFLCHRGQICVRGRRLFCSSYCTGTAVIDGVIDGVTFEEVER